MVEPRETLTVDQLNGFSLIHKKVEVPRGRLHGVSRRPEGAGNCFHR